MAAQTTQPVRVRHKGQITLPADIREKLHLSEGDLLTVHEEEGRIILENPLQKLRRVLEVSAAYFAELPPLEAEEISHLASEAITHSTVEKLARIEDERSED